MNGTSCGICGRFERARTRAHAGVAGQCPIWASYFATSVASEFTSGDHSVLVVVLTRTIRGHGLTLENNLEIK